MKDLIERLKTDLNDPNKKSAPFILNWTEAVIRRLWHYASDEDKGDEDKLDCELIALGLGAMKRLKGSNKLEICQHVLEYYKVAESL